MWYNSSWLYRQKITIDHTKVGADLTDYPVYVNLANLSSGFFSHVKSDGGDIRITKSDGITEVPVEVVSITVGSSIGEIHFKATGTLATASDTEFYIYYGNSGASLPAIDSTYGAENVWDSNYKLVYHMDGSGSSIIDSTSNSIDGTKLTSTEPTEATGILGKAQHFDGRHDVITSANLTIDDPLTVQAWAKPDTTTPGAFKRIVENNYITSFTLLTGAGDTADEYAFFTTDDYPDLSGAGDITDQSWSYLVGTHNAGSSRIRVNTTNGNTATNPAPSSVNIPVYIGRYVVGGDTKHSFDGLIDEVRISNIVRLDNWFLTEYNNQNSPSTFYSIGSEEEDVVSFVPSIIFI